MNAPAKIEPPQVYAKIAAVQGALAKVGISKSRKNQTPGQNYNFRGIDEIYNTLAPLLSEHGLSILPRILSRELTERKSARGNPLFYVVVEAEFDFVAVDGSVHTVRTYGEAMDSSDKATNKAMSAAYKYAALMTFAIPTEGDNDADATTHEVAPGDEAESKVSPRRTKWEGRYGCATKLKQAMHTHHAELNRLGSEGTHDDLDIYLSSPEYKDFIAEATVHAPYYLEGPQHPNSPPEFIQTFILEQKARDLIALRGNVPADLED